MGLSGGLRTRSNLFNQCSHQKGRLVTLFDIRDLLDARCRELVVYSVYFPPQFSLLTPTGRDHVPGLISQPSGVRWTRGAVQLCWKPQPGDRANARAILLSLEGDIKIDADSRSDSMLNDSSSFPLSCLRSQAHFRLSSWHNRSIDQTLWRRTRGFTAGSS